MQQLILTLIALLGLFVPTANNRIARFFLRFVPSMSSGHVARDVEKEAATGTLSGQPQGKQYTGHHAEPRRALFIGALLNLLKKGEQLPAWSRPDSLQRRIRRAQRAAVC
jgi:hypothetical protein